jgi:hypothetical protein
MGAACFVCQMPFTLRLASFPSSWLSPKGEFGVKVKGYATKNITAIQEFVRDLTHAKDIQYMFRIQMAFMQAQMNAFGEQAKSLGEAYIKAA